jgi:hypothetical protein
MRIGGAGRAEVKNGALSSLCWIGMLVGTLVGNWSGLGWGVSGMCLLGKGRWNVSSGAREYNHDRLWEC